MHGYRRPIDRASDNLGGDQLKGVLRCGWTWKGNVMLIEIRIRLKRVKLKMEQGCIYG